MYPFSVPAGFIPAVSPREVKTRPGLTAAETVTDDETAFASSVAGDPSRISRPVTVHCVPFAIRPLMTLAPTRKAPDPEEVRGALTTFYPRRLPNPSAQEPAAPVLTVPPAETA